MLFLIYQELIYVVSPFSIAIFFFSTNHRSLMALYAMHLLPYISFHYITNLVHCFQCFQFKVAAIDQYAILPQRLGFNVYWNSKFSIL